MTTARPWQHPDRDQMMTVDEVAPVLRVSRMTVYRMIHSGVLPAYQIGRSFRVTRKALREYLLSAEVGA
jgi:excisionase family DNA binding protein